jgi:CRISPR-associated endonuclease Csn1
LIVETVNNLRIIEGRNPPRTLTVDERTRILDYLGRPLGMAPARRKKGDTAAPQPKPKTTVSVTDLRILMGWGKATKSSTSRFNVESDDDRVINTDWFSREIVHGAISLAKWNALPERVRDGVNRALLQFDPDDESHAARFREGLLSWGTLDETKTEAVLAAWRRRPNIDAKRLSMSRRAVRNILALMDRSAPWPDTAKPGDHRWLTAIEARKAIADDEGFLDRTTGKPLDGIARERYATGAKGSTARDRYYMRKHVLMSGGKPVLDPEGRPLSEPPPAPMISNPVVRKAIHEVRRHLVAYMKRFGRRPEQVYVELSREARMGKMDADRLLLRNRLRNRIRNDIDEEFSLHSLAPAQQRTACVRVILAVQQNGVCPLCGNTVVKTSITPRRAAGGEDCEVAHIVPRACGGHDGLSNIVLAHTKCNRDMHRRTPREFWTAAVPGGFDAAMTWVEAIYREVDRPKPSELRSAKGNTLWKCYFTRSDDLTKLEQFSKNVTDIQGMTARQDAATKYAARQVMSYLADALYEGQGLPERGGTQRIFASDGIWTSRLRREWGLFFDVHGARRKDIPQGDRHDRREKNRGDHRHHAIDAVVICCSTADVQREWEKRDRDAERAIPNSADEAALEAYRRLHPLSAPSPFRSHGQFHHAVESAVFGNTEAGKPICHRPVKRKLIGALHEETLLGPVIGDTGGLTGLFTCKKPTIGLTPNHLRMPVPETEKEAIARLVARRMKEKKTTVKDARKWAKAIVTAASYKPAVVDPPPAKSGIVRDIGLRRRIRECIVEAGFDPDTFKPAEMKKMAESGAIHQRSGVPIRSAALLRTMSDPVIVARQKPSYATKERSPDPNPASQRAYIGGNNHHIEIRVDSDGKFTGSVISAFEASQRKRAKLRAFRRESIPRPSVFKQLPRREKNLLRPIIREIELAHPIVDRRDDNSRGGSFVMSLCEGETIRMRPKLSGGELGSAGYYVVAKLEKPNTVVLVPHWDARSATERKDADGKTVSGSRREQFSIVPSDLPMLAPEGSALPVKVVVDPLGTVTPLVRD